MFAVINRRRRSIKIDPYIQPASITGKVGTFDQAVQRFEQAHAQKANRSVKPQEDVVEISSLGRLLSREDQAQGVRMALIEKVKAEIALGSYDKPEKVDQVLNRLFVDLDALS
jgi:anti-sigma28 factor (negative regulator of flagellin synthesis)